MIGIFRHRGLKRLYGRGDGSRIPAQYAGKLENILFLLDTGSVVEALDLPGLRLHPLTGDLKGYWSITVRANWRVIFRFQEGKPSISIWLATTRTTGKGGSYDGKIQSPPSGPPCTAGMH